MPQAGDFPQSGSLESLAAGRVLDRLAAQVADRSPSSSLGKLAAGGRAVDGGDAVEAAQAGDPEAIEVLRTLGERLGIGIANALNTFDPDAVVIGGGVSVAGELLLGPATEVARRFALPGIGERAEIRLARHGREAGVRGAALLAGLELAEEREALTPSAHRGGPGVSVAAAPANPFAQDVEQPLPDPTVLVIFGAGGDLTGRKLIPAVYNLH